MSNKIPVKPNTLSVLHELNEKVQKIVPARYFIAGGSCAETVKHGKIYVQNDIDMYFENEKQLEVAQTKLIKADWGISMENDVAVTYAPNFLNTVNWDEIETELKSDISIIQLIKLYGTPKEVLNNFDLNKSQIGITSYGKLFTVGEYNVKIPLKINFNNFNYQTGTRFMKYSLAKGYLFNSSELVKLIHYMVNDNKIIDYYDNVSKTTLKSGVLYNFVRDINSIGHKPKNPHFRMDKVLDIIINALSGKSPKEFIDIFQSICLIKIDYESPNLLVYVSLMIVVVRDYKILPESFVNNINRILESKKDRIMIEYPEFLV